MSLPSAPPMSRPKRALFLLLSFAFLAAVQGGLHLVDGAPYLGSLLRAFEPVSTQWFAVGLAIALTLWQAWRILGGGEPRFALLSVAALLPAMYGAVGSVLGAVTFDAIVSSGVTTATDATLITLEGLQSVAAGGTIANALSTGLLLVGFAAVALRARGHGLRSQVVPLLSLGCLVLTTGAGVGAGITTLRDFAAAHEALWQLGQSPSTAPEALIPILSPVATPGALLGLIGALGLVAFLAAVRTAGQRVLRAASVVAVMASLLLIAGVQHLAGVQWHALSAAVVTRQVAAQR